MIENPIKNTGEYVTLNASPDIPNKRNVSLIFRMTLISLIVSAIISPDAHPTASVPTGYQNLIARKVIPIIAITDVAITIPFLTELTPLEKRYPAMFNAQSGKNALISTKTAPITAITSKTGFLPELLSKSDFVDFPQYGQTDAVLGIDFLQCLQII